MQKYVLSLGFRAYSHYLAENVKEVLDKKGLDMVVEGFGSRGSLKKWLDQNADLNHEGDLFDPNTGLDDAPDSELWKPYRSDNIELFVCSTITRDDSGEYAAAVSDGERFAKSIIPGIPLVIVHFGSEYRGSAKIDYMDRLNRGLLVQDAEKRIYHLPWECKTEPQKKISNKSMKDFLEKLFDNNMIVHHRDYIEFLERSTKEIFS